MRHKVTMLIEREKRDIFGRTRIVTEKRNVYVDGKTYRQIRAQQQDDAISLEELLFYDMIFDD